MAVPVYAYAFLDDLVLLYPVYALLFAEHGLSTADISALFIVWSVTGVVLEVPSGVLADRLSRRLLLVTAPLCAAAGFSLWTFAPGHPAFVVGFLLWGAGGAMKSGAREALVYEELDRLGAADRYPDVMGRALSLATLSVAIATGLAAPVMALWGYAGVGVASVLACLLCAAVAVMLPEHRTGIHPHSAAHAVQKARVLREALHDVRRTPGLLGAVLAVPAAVAIWGALEEYVGLLAVEQGVPVAVVPLVMLVVYAGAAAGGLLGGRASRLRDAALPVVLVTGAVPLGAGALWAGVPGTLLVALAFGAFQAAQVVADTRLQDAIEGGGRATVTSLAGLATDVAIIGVYVGYGLASGWAEHAVLYAVAAAAYGVIAAALVVTGRLTPPRSRR